MPTLQTAHLQFSNGTGRAGRAGLGMSFFWGLHLLAVWHSIVWWILFFVPRVYATSSFSRQTHQTRGGRARERYH